MAEIKTSESNMENGPGTAVTGQKVEEKLWGIDIGAMSQKHLAMLLCGGALISAVVFTYLQEKIFTMPGFHFGGFVALMTSLTYCVCAGLDAYFFLDGGIGGFLKKATYKDFIILSLFPAGGMYLTNWSLNYLNYPTRIMFKSSKVVPTMIVGTFMQGKKYSWKQYANAGLLILGLAIFSLGEKELSPRFSTTGIVLILLGTTCDAFTSNIEEAKFFNEFGCSYQEVTFYAYLFGSLWTLIALVLTSEAVESYAYCSENPIVIAYGVISSVAGYTSVVFVMLLIKHFGATITEVVKSCRKVFSIIVSYTLLAPKPFSSKHQLGGLLFGLSLLIGVLRKGA